MASLLDIMPTWLAGAVSFALFCGAALAGTAVRRGRDPGVETMAATAGAISLLALLVGFTFSLALSRYDTRRDLVIEEAAAVAMVWHRVGLEPEPMRGRMMTLVRAYLDDRLEFFRLGNPVDRKRAADKAADAMQAELWSITRALSDADVRPLVTRGVIDALTRMGDAARRREALEREHIPLLVLDLLTFAGAVTAAIIGYATATRRAVQLAPNLAFFLLIAVAIVLVTDLDRPRGGLVRVSQQPMLDLEADLADRG